MDANRIFHPPGDRSLTIREWQVTFCKGDIVAAALLSYFEYCHKECCSEKNPYFCRNEEELIDGIFGIGKKDSIRRAIGFLEKQGCISIHLNPYDLPQGRFDRTRYFLFHPEVLVRYLVD